MAFFTARQPILDIDKNVFGYELLFRASADNVFPDIDQEKATSKMVEGLQFDLGLDKIASGKFAFINFTEQSILRSYPLLLPKTGIVVEVLETVTTSPALYEQFKVLFKKGYSIALDDFVHTNEWEPYYQFCKIIKVDCLLVTSEQLIDIAEIKKRHPHIALLAEKVETYEHFQDFANMGFTLFQGYFFSKPEVIKTVSLTSSQTQISSILNEITKSEIDIDSLTKLVEVDVGLTFKILRFSQSPLFKRQKAIANVRQAIVMLGKYEFEKFIMLLFVASLGEDKPSELIKLAIHRAKFCEQVALSSGQKDNVSAAFLVGMLSLIDAMLDADIEELVGSMPLSDNIKQALLLHKGWLANIILLCQMLERGQWSKIEKACLILGIDCDATILAYEDAADWAEERLTFLL